MKSTMTYSELVPCFRNKFARKKYGCRVQWYITFHVSFKEQMMICYLHTAFNVTLLHRFDSSLERMIICYLHIAFKVTLLHRFDSSLKLVRTPLNVYFTAFKSIFLSLCTYYLVWMSCLISFKRCQSSCEEHGTSEHYKKFLSMVGFEPPTSHPLISSVSLFPLG